ncbi:MAG: hypothetical protein JNM75_11745 [Rhodospirillales bacterium]|nr:hypothetical protein [Rhodospirillales bacterium]
MTISPAGKRPDVRATRGPAPFGDDIGFDLLDQIDDFADPDLEEIVGTAHRVAAGESFD